MKTKLSQPSPSLLDAPNGLMFPDATAPVQAPAPPPEDPDPWVAFGSYVHRSIYLQLKQAEYYEPGFEIREFVDNALQQALQQLPAAQRELPAQVLEKLRKTNRKLGA
ncbi:hypothetical protein MTX78_24965 (plasmid) [Hymenobacter tibetensis]|uniref:Uncharacterized protein n=1 Tax=Hymenobacter tibetensis TaxID=497967 RepID=A0ABY4D5L3_9BACT|nr:hypothetical protein [Hymenobacter tibetensis]UOG77617.1 hypothetical protein MTX78_24965 [Hymenobacter tibetensis]